MYLGYFHILSAANLPFKKAYLVKLDSKMNYRLEGSDLVYGGDALMNMGLDMPYVCAMQPDQANYLEKGDFTSKLLVLKRAS